MKKTLTKILSVMLIVCITLTSAPLSGLVGLELPDWLDFSITSKAAETSGTCGENLTWTFDETTGTLTIAGTGEMYRYYDHESDYCDDGDFPWNHLRNDIKKIIVEDGVTQICDVSFASCINLTCVELPKTLNEIGAFSFEECTSLSKVIISADNIVIERRAFSGCESLSEIIFGDGNISIGTYAFEKCTSLTNITIPENVELTGDHAFSKCSGLIAVNLLSKSISYGTFENCTKLTDVVLSNNVTSILDSAFWRCENIESIVIPTSINTIEHGAFEGCSKLSDVYYLGSQEQWNKIYIASYNGPLLNATIHYNIETGKCGNNLTWNFEKSTGTLTISGTGDMYRYYDYDSDYCDDGDFPWNHLRKDIKKIIVEEGVTQICDFSFASCTNLTSVTFPDTLNEIGAYAFSKCTSLINVSISGNKTYIENYAFSECVNLSKLTLGDGIKSIYDYAFSGCKNLFDITVGNNITWIGKYVFSDSAWYKNDDNWDNGVLYLGNYLIIANSDIISGEYTVKDGTKVIASEAFVNCRGLTKINFPDGLVTICSRAFYQCYNLQGIDIPSSVSNIGAYAFYGCSQITSVTIPKGITHISDGVFWWCRNLTTVTIPQSVTYVGLGSFCDCDNIKDVYYYGTEEEWKAIVRDAGNDIFGANVHFHEHIYNEWEITKEPTCLNRGYKISFCDCGKRNGVYTDALGHDIIIDKAVNPDCINTGLTVGEHCSRCDYKVEQTVVDALGHNYDSVITPPTCTDRGYTTYDCTVCADTYTSDYIGALGHTAGEIVEENYVAPTCTTNGSKDNVTYCAVCNTETSRETISIPALGHIEEEISAVEPTCTETGLTTGVKCSVCDEVLEPQQEVPALGHDIITDYAVSPNCTNTGLTAGEHCSRCDYKVEQTVIDALGHKYDSVITAPTCTSEGYTTYTCHCGDTYIGDYVDALAHNYKDGICADCETPDPTYFTFEIQKPSRTTMRCNDGIKLHTKVTGKLPDGSRIEWSKNNNNFNMTTSASGNEITIISKNNGYTTFTATVYDADNNVIAQDTIEIYSKAGLFDKIGGFFRSLFGTTKIYEN